METTRRLIDYYLPPGDGFVLESLVATTYQVDFEFFEEELLASALGVRSPVSRLKAFRSELERKLQKAEVSVLYDLGGCERLVRLSPRIDAIPVSGRKLHSKISLLMWIRESHASGAPPDRRMRLIVGSANLTRQGFRSNYECVVSVDFGGRSMSPRKLLTSAIGFVQQIRAESTIPQLSRQLAAFETQAHYSQTGLPSQMIQLPWSLLPKSSPPSTTLGLRCRTHLPTKLRQFLRSGPREQRLPKLCLISSRSLVRPPTWSWCVVERSHRMGKNGCPSSTAALR